MQADKFRFIRDSKTQLIAAKFAHIDIYDVTNCLKREFPLFRKTQNRQAAMAISLYVGICLDNIKNFRQEYTIKDIASHCNLPNREAAYYYYNKFNKLKETNESYLLSYMSTLYDLLVLENKKNKP